jgi:DNA replication and repair protein RecF
MSELDLTRRERLASELRSGGQSVVTTTEAAHVPGWDAAEVTLVSVP